MELVIAWLAPSSHDSPASSMSDTAFVFLFFRFVFRCCLSRARCVRLKRRAVLKSTGKDGSNASVPTTVQEIVAARIDALDPALGLVLKVKCALNGKPAINTRPTSETHHESLDTCGRYGRGEGIWETWQLCPATWYKVRRHPKSRGVSLRHISGK